MNSSNKINANNEQEFAHAYRQNHLSEDDAQLFEEYLMEHPELLESVQLDEVFTQVLPEVNPKVVNSEQYSNKNLWQSLLWFFGGGATAAFAFLVFIGTGPASNNLYQGVDNVVYVETLRSTTDIHTTIELGKDQKTVLLMIPAGFDQNGPFDLTIRRQSDQSMLLSARLLKTDTGDLAIVLNTADIIEGIYTVNIVDDESKQSTNLNLKFLKN